MLLLKTTYHTHLYQKGAITMPLPRDDFYTIDDIYKLPEGQRAELIDGQIYSMTPPNRIHQKISYRLSKAIGNYIDSNNGSCEVYPAPFAVFIAKDDQNYVEPDISVVCDKSKLSDRGCEGAPDFIIEIVSPSTQRMDYGTKLFKYRTAGVREYWIVNPAKQVVNVYNFENEESANLYSFDDEIPVGIYPGFTIKILDLLQ